MDMKIFLGKVEKRKYEDREYATLSALSEGGDPIKTSIYDAEVYGPALADYAKNGPSEALLHLSAYAKSDGRLGVRIDQVEFV